MISNRKTLLAIFGTLALTVATLSAQDDTKPRPSGVVIGPGTAKLGTVAELNVPAGYMFLDGKTTRAMMKKAGEPVSGNELGFLRPTNGHWSVFFEFDETGYIKDDEKDKLDADKILKSIKEGNEEGNKERVAAGNSPLVIVGWEIPPKYDETTHNLEWAIRATSDGQPLLNYNTRLLGRKGVMETVLVVEPDELAATLPEFRGLLANNYKYQTGESYAEFKPGDKIAKYGLGALIVGGAAVGAAKLGLLGPLLLILKKAWKLVIVAVVAVASFFKRTFKAFFGRPENENK